MIESLKKIIAHSLQNDCAVFFSPESSRTSTMSSRASQMSSRGLTAGSSEFTSEIKNAHLYPLTGSGKLLRPLIVLLTAGSFGSERGTKNALSSALAVEFVHTYSLVHDDLPCMDNDSLRRGKPTTHVVYGEAKGLLVGDGLLTAAFEILSSQVQLSARTALKLIHILSKAVGARGMIYGQWIDISNKENIDQSSTSEIFHTLHTNKTGKLFAACFEMGFLCGLESITHSYSETHIQDMQKKIFQVGLDMGLAFQIMDDILDVTQSSEALGKTAGKDTEQNKLTAVKIFGIKDAQEYANDCLNRALKSFQNILETSFPDLFQKNEEYTSSLFTLLKNTLKF